MEFALLLIVTGLALLAVYHMFSILEQRASHGGTYTACIENLQEAQAILNQVEVEEPDAAEQRRLKEAHEHIREAMTLVDQTRLTRKLLYADYLVFSMLQRGPPDRNPPARFDPRPQSNGQFEDSHTRDDTADAPAK